MIKTVSLHILPGEPLKVKRITGAGRPVRGTDNGEPLWILQPAQGAAAGEAKRRRAIDQILDEVSRGQSSKISLSKIVLESRR